jgi:hypothetical protein
MKKIIFILVVSTLFIATINPYSAYSAGEKSGYILLQVEKTAKLGMSIRETEINIF